MTRQRRAAHLGELHPLAAVARDRCRVAHPNSTHRLGRMACGRCWERVIRDDERVAVMFGLPRELAIDPTFVDEVAIERACQGKLVRLTKAERRAAVIRLVALGLTPAQAAERLGISGSAALAAVTSDNGLAA